MNGDRKRDLKTQATNVSTSVPRVSLVRLRHRFTFSTRSVCCLHFRNAESWEEQIVCMSYQNLKRSRKREVMWRRYTVIKSRRITICPKK